MAEQDPLEKAASELAMALIAEKDPATLTQALLEAARGSSQSAQQVDTGSPFDGVAQAMTNLMGGWQPEQENPEGAGSQQGGPGKSAPTPGASSATAGSSDRAGGGTGTLEVPVPVQTGPTGATG